MLITFEGIDFSGKSTQARLLVGHLEEHCGGRRTVHFIREPGGTTISERIRTILLDRSHPEMTDAAELLLFSASRAQLVAEVIRPALGRGDIVVCDRYYDSTTAYQGYGRGLNLDAIHRINALAVAGTEPDLTLLLDISVDELERRRRAAGSVSDRMERSGRDFYERVRRGYLELAGNAAHRFVRIDGAAPVQGIEAEIWEQVLHRLEIQTHTA